MSIQSTVEITREEAEKRYVQKRINELESIFTASSKKYSNSQLEDEINEMFYNYQIVE